MPALAPAPLALSQGTRYQLNKQWYTFVYDFTKHGIDLFLFVSKTGQNLSVTSKQLLDLTVINNFYFLYRDDTPPLDNSLLDQMLKKYVFPTHLATLKAACSFASNSPHWKIGKFSITTHGVVVEYDIKRGDA